MKLVLGKIAGDWKDECYNHKALKHYKKLGLSGFV